MRFLFCYGLLLLSFAGCGSGGSHSVRHPPPGPTVTSLNDVQGPGDSSPLEGSIVIVHGVVTGDFQDGDADILHSLGGFYIQAEVTDADPATSDGVFVVDGATPATDINVGDKVAVEGEVLEYFGETRIEAISVSITGSGTVSPVDITFPMAVARNSDGNAIAGLERFEGMLVRVSQPLTVTGLFNLERYGQVQLAAHGRQMQFTNQMAPDVAAYKSHLLALTAVTLVLDDGLSRQNVSPIRYLFPDPVQSPDYSIRVGDLVTGLTGNIRYSRGSGSAGAAAYRLMPQAAPQFSSANPREALPPAVGGNLKVASFNVLNFFTSIDSGQRICGPAGNSGCRGADNVAEFERQRQKILTALASIDADIVGLIELENNASASLQSIVDGLNAAAASSRWSFIDSGTIGSDVIRVGIIYKPAHVSPVGSFSVLDGTVDARFLDERNRPILLQTFEQKTNREMLGVAVAHLKSKGSSCKDIGDPDRRDGQGNCNATRNAAMQALVDWLATDPTASNDPDFLIVGDLNAYLEEDPLQTLEAAGYVNLLATLLSHDAYSFQFRGQSGALDHALVSRSLLHQVSGVAEWHINADEPPVLDYNLEFGRDAVLFDATSPFRASDHDPVIVGFTLNANGAGK